MTLIRDSLSIILLTSLIFAGPVFAQEAVEEGSDSAASEAENLRQEIDSKNAELQKILEEREQIVRQLEETGEQKGTLQKELKNIDATINQLNLSIKANRLMLEKLELEIKSLGGEITNTEKLIENKKKTIAKLFVELQQKDRENLLIIFLKNQSLAESVSEAQSITELNINLSETAEEMRGFQQDLIHKLSEEQSKKRQQEIERANLINRQDIVSDQKSVKTTVLTQTKNQEKQKNSRSHQSKCLSSRIKREH